MTQASDGDGGGGEDKDEFRVLRAKYFDYYSSRIADELLALSPDDLYVLARKAAGGTGSSDDLPFTRMVDLATLGIMRRIGLPSFEEWLEAYRQDPSRYDSELLGLWRTEVDPEPTD